MQDDPAHVQRELKRYAPLFDTIERAPLTHEQRVAAVTLAARNVVIAAAGSGKTSTMVGKVAYALCSGRYKPDEILVLAFNRKAATELDVRLRQRLAPYLTPGTQVVARTLHALGLDIVTRVRHYRPRVDDVQSGLLSQILRQIVQHNTNFAEHWYLFRVFYHVKVRHPDQFERRQQWRLFVRQHGECRSGRYGFVTQGDELVPTQFEQAVANWLYLYRIEHHYAPLSHRARMALWFAEPYLFPLSGRSGFFLPEHQRFVVCVQRKPKRVKTSASALYITLDEFRAGTVFQTLRRQLCRNHDNIPPEHLRAALKSLGHRMTSGQTKFLLRFIRVARLNGLHPDTILTQAALSPDPSRTTLHAVMLAQLLSAYNATLQRDGTIDFEGMLQCAADYIDAGDYRHAYKLILVDEFQDTSYAGLRLLKSLLAQSSACKFFAVGDDWQSIYRFAGAVPDVLSRFDVHFGAMAINYLTTTFRFNQAIADIASGFIQANSDQLRKTVRARQPDAGASVLLARYGSAEHMFALCEACLADCITALSDGREQRPNTVFILGRYQHQRPPQLEQWQKQFASLAIEFQTVHAAKGLEADVVIVLGLHEGRHGFPSQIKEDPLIALVMPTPESFPYAEERRLFYVAMTRSRHRVYLLADIHEPSQFVVELEAKTQTNVARDQPLSGFVKLC